MNKPLTPFVLLKRVLIALVLLLVVLIACAMTGSEKIDFRNALSGPKMNPPNIDYEILVNVRLPRVILAAIVGMALACAGAALQAVLRNPLADPYILGISSGAGLGAMLAVIAGFQWMFLGLSSITICAFASALATVWLVWLLGNWAGRNNLTGLLLTGVVVNAFFSAVIMFLTSIAKAHQVQTTIFWLMGNIMTPEYPGLLWFCLAVVLAGLAVLIWLGPRLNLLSFNHEDAALIGLNVPLVCHLTFAAAALITAMAVSLSGLVGFVGLIVPHAIRITFGPDHRQLIPLSAIAGAGFVVLCDTFARVVVAPAQLPVGVVTALAGGPFFLFLLIRYSRNFIRLEK